MKRTVFVLIATAILFAASCVSKPVVVPENLSFEEIVQRAQEASDRYNYQAALGYYRVGLERFSSEPAKVVACTYEIGFIHYKQGEYALAADKFTTLFSLYDEFGPSLPPRYLILARKVYPKIEAKLAEGVTKGVPPTGEEIAPLAEGTPEQNATTTASGEQ
ncbi:MAG: hypothetical protein NT080_03715 [Spirochaetes bacterium]|nr:hypothetical protein [Spirochaetota bacterium]